MKTIANENMVSVEIIAYWVLCATIGHCVDNIPGMFFGLAFGIISTTIYKIIF